MSRFGFRGRLFLILLSFALIPAVVLTVAWTATSYWVLPLVGTTAAWDSVAATGSRAVEAARAGELSPEARAAFDAHEQRLSESVLYARQARFVYRRAPAVALATGLVALAVLTLIALRVAGHLSRALTRPLEELVGWTDRIARRQPIPVTPPRRGAPEFARLRDGMRAMASELELGREQELELARASALRESARQVAHELKNPLTPIRFAVDRLRRDAPPELADTVEVLAVESARIEALARSFAQFGRLPEGPTAPVDLGELARYTARATIPESMTVEVTVEPETPYVQGHYEALSRALANVMLNAVDACAGGGAVQVHVAPTELRGRDAVEVAVTDSGMGIPPDRLDGIWEPYVTSKAGGTGLGLAIVRQAVEAHEGRVSAESTAGRGTTIRMILPVESAAAVPQHPSLMNTSSLPARPRTWPAS